MITWQSYGQDGSGYGIYSKVYNADGTVRSYVEPVPFTEGAAAALLYTDISLADGDSTNLESALITLTDPVPGDSLGLLEVAGSTLPSLKFFPLVVTSIR